MRDIRNGVCPLCDHEEIVAGQPAEFANNIETNAAFAYEERWMGYLQWFVDDPGSVPIGDEYRTRLVEVNRKTEGPFR